MHKIVKKTLSYSTREEEHTHMVHLFTFPMERHPGDNCSAFSRGWCITSTVAAPGKALNEGSSNSHLEAEPAPCPCNLSIAFVFQQLLFPTAPSRLRSRSHPPRHDRDHESLRTVRVSACFRRIIQTQQQQFVLRFPKNQQRGWQLKAKWH